MEANKRCREDAKKDDLDGRKRQYLRLEKNISTAGARLWEIRRYQHISPETVRTEEENARRQIVGPGQKTYGL